MMRFLRLPNWLLTLLTLVIIAACQSNPTSSPIAQNCRSVSHAMGTTQVCGKPEKVVVLGSHSLDLLLSLDEQPAGFGDRFPFIEGDVYDQPATQIPYLGQFVTSQPVNVGGSGQPSLEAIAQLQPDLIIGEAGSNESIYDLLSQIAPTLLWDIRTQLGQWQTNIRALALALGDESKAEDAIAQYDRLVAAAREDLNPIVANNPKTLIIGMNSLKTGAITAITAQSYLGELMEKIGFELVAPASSLNYAPLSVEVLPDFDEAQYIFVLGYSMEQQDNVKELIASQTSGIKSEWSENPIAQSLTASQRDRVYFSTYFLWNGLNGPLGTELILEQLRQFLLPE